MNPPCSARPFMIAAIAEFAHAVMQIVAAARAVTAREPDHSVRFEPARSAEPPISSGKAGARSFDDASATLCASRSCSPSLALASMVSLRMHCSEVVPAARLACVARIRSACSGCALAYSASVRFQATSQVCALAARIPQFVDMRGNFERCVVPPDCGARQPRSPARPAARRAHRECPPCSANLSR